jgi:hypothetical protein
VLQQSLCCGLMAAAVVLQGIQEPCGAATGEAAVRERASAPGSTHDAHLLQVARVQVMMALQATWQGGAAGVPCLAVAAGSCKALIVLDWAATVAFGPGVVWQLDGRCWLAHEKMLHGCQRQKTQWSV